MRIWREGRCTRYDTVYESRLKKDDGITAPATDWYFLLLHLLASGGALGQSTSLLSKPDTTCLASPAYNILPPTCSDFFSQCALTDRQPSAPHPTTGVPHSANLPVTHRTRFSYGSVASRSSPQLRRIYAPYSPVTALAQIVPHTCWWL